MADTLLKGGEFLIAETAAEDVFTPEDFNENQRMFSTTVDGFVQQVIHPVRDDLEYKGKTELGKLWAGFHRARLIRLQCYEGLDESKALYEWAYGKQMLYTQLLRDKLSDVLIEPTTLDEIFMGYYREEEAER